jgi:hypothetical protein
MNRQHHTLDQSALYHITTKSRLFKVLLVHGPQLRVLARSGIKNYRQFSLAGKEGKGPRWIEAPKPDLQRVQRRIHDLLIRTIPPPFLFSGFPRKSAVDNAAVHTVDHRMVKLDITSFYASSNGHRVYDFFREEMRCSSEISRIFFELITVPATTASDHPHLPTGGVTSPIFAYFAYQSMFLQLLDLANSRGLTMSVMVDDITFSGSAADHKVLSAARRIISAHGLVSKRKKERVWSAGKPKTVTGVVLTRRGLRLPNKRWERMQILRYELWKASNPVERSKLFRRLAGSLFSAGSIEAKYHRQGLDVHRSWRNDTAAWAARTNLDSQKIKG